MVCLHSVDVDPWSDTRPISTKQGTHYLVRPHQRKYTHVAFFALTWCFWFRSHRAKELSIHSRAGGQIVGSRNSDKPLNYLQKAMLAMPVELIDHRYYAILSERWRPLHASRASALSLGPCSIKEIDRWVCTCTCRPQDLKRLRFSMHDLVLLKENDVNETSTGL